MRNSEEIIFKIDNISNLNDVSQKHEIRCVGINDLKIYNEHLKLCVPKIKRIFFRGVSQAEWERWNNDGIEFYLLFADGKPVSRCSIEPYSELSWEAADVKTAPKYRCNGYSKEIVAYVTKSILMRGKTATCSTLPYNFAMLNVINALGYSKAEIGDFFDVSIEPLKPEEYSKCSNIWNMKNQPLTEKWYEEIVSGNRMVFIYKINGIFIGEGALVKHTDDSDYTIPDKRIYISRMIVKKEYRNRGIGNEILTFLVEKAKSMGYSEMTIGVDKDNDNAVHLYKKFGFTEVLFDGEDEHGAYLKLMKRV